MFDSFEAELYFKLKLIVWVGDDEDDDGTMEGIQQKHRKHLHTDSNSSISTQSSDSDNNDDEDDLDFMGRKPAKKTLILKQNSSAKRVYKPATGTELFLWEKIQKINKLII